jgi:endonuclease III
LPKRVGIKQSHDFLQALVPKPIRRSLHINLVHHGRAVCVPLNPRCDRCVLSSRCLTGQSRSRARRNVGSGNSTRA